jgi:ABC-type lipoprotein export system ATPase subunit
VIVELRDVFCVHRTAEGDAAALQGMTITLAEGELLCVLGPSGAGKSTLLRVVAGLEVPAAGIVRVLGVDIGRQPVRARARLRNEEIGFLDQHSESALPPDLPISGAVGLPLALRGIDGAARRSRVSELLAAAGLKDHRDALPGELSGGERQRAALCAALAHEPALLLADEPTGELDRVAAERIRELIVELARSRGASVIIVSHDPETARMADRAVRIRDGRVVEDHRDGQSALVVGRGGWLQLPPELLRRTGIADRALVRHVDGGLVVTPARATVAAGPPAPQSPPSSGEATTLPLTRSANERPARVELTSVTRDRGRGRSRRRVIDCLSLTFMPGEMTAVTGPSGSGKTTLLRLLAALDRPDQGDVLFDALSTIGWDAERRASLRRERIGYLPQQPAPVGFLSAGENIVLALRLRGWEQSAAAEQATVTLARVGLADRSRQRVGRLSAGEAQRVALARALACARGLLVVDEPTSRLDETGAVAIAELLADAAGADGQTVICATHDGELVRRATRVVEL